jgi:lipid-A-disaccharide synthase
MKRFSFMVIAGEASGDTLAAELVRALREELVRFQARPTEEAQPRWASLEPRFFGAGGPRMAEAGVELVEDMTAHAVFGLVDVLKKLRHFVQLRNQLKALAVERQPDMILCVDYSGFNRRLARAIKDHVRAGEGSFNNWNPRVVQFVSPQVWASRPGRARAMIHEFDLVLSIFPFEKAWYGERTPSLRVEFVGHPMVDRYSLGTPKEPASLPVAASQEAPSRVVLLPGSRVRELKRHLPVLLGAARIIASKKAVAWRMILPTQALAESARGQAAGIPNLQVQAGGLAEALGWADLAMASSGTVTLECAFFGVPTVVLYRVSWIEFQVALRIVKVPHIAMPNLLSGQTVYPEFVQQDATPASLATAAIELLENGERRAWVKTQLATAVQSLGPPGAAGRAARAILGLLDEGAARTSTSSNT